MRHKIDQYDKLFIYHRSLHDIKVFVADVLQKWALQYGMMKAAFRQVS